MIVTFFLLLAHNSFASLALPTNLRCFAPKDRTLQSYDFLKFCIDELTLFNDGDKSWVVFNGGDLDGVSQDLIESEGKYKLEVVILFSLPQTDESIQLTWRSNSSIGNSEFKQNMTLDGKFYTNHALTVDLEFETVN